MALPSRPKTTILGQDTAVLLAVWANVVSWCVKTFVPQYLPRLVPAIPQAEADDDDETAAAGSQESFSSRQTRCIVIARPGGMEQLKLLTLKPHIATCGYNIEERDKAFTKPLALDDASSSSTTNILPPDAVLLQNHAFSVNYADCCIRWGLYESAKEYVGYPIVPGFDVAGVVEHVGDDADAKFQIGDRVYGCTLFGAYSSRVLVPAMQLRQIPHHLSFAQAASLPAVSLTALYALFLAGHWPVRSKFTNKSILIHSAAGGVGSMLVQMAKLLGCSPVVGVVGRADKVDAAMQLGCDVVIDKSTQNLWHEALKASPDGYSAIMDSNGVATLQDSYDNLCMTGRLIVFGFHSNLPLGRDMLSPLEWLSMARKMKHMPKFDAMEMGGHNKAVLAFNLSFVAQEREMLSELFDQVQEWLERDLLHVPRVVEMSMDRIAEAHELIQSGRSIGKIVQRMKTSVSSIKLHQLAAKNMPVLLDFLYGLPLRMDVHNAVVLRHLATYFDCVSLRETADDFCREQLSGSWPGSVFYKQAMAVQSMISSRRLKIIASRTLRSFVPIGESTLCGNSLCFWRAFLAKVGVTQTNSALVSTAVAGAMEAHRAELDRSTFVEFTKDLQTVSIGAASTLLKLECELMCDPPDDPERLTTLQSKCIMCMAQHFGKEYNDWCFEISESSPSVVLLQRTLLRWAREIVDRTMQPTPPAYDRNRF